MFMQQAQMPPHQPPYACALQQAESDWNSSVACASLVLVCWSNLCWCCAGVQVAKQEGEFVADLLLKNAFSPDVGTVKLEPKQKPFK
jgi:hypothetical protein